MRAVKVYDASRGLVTTGITRLCRVGPVPRVQLCRGSEWRRPRKPVRSELQAVSRPFRRKTAQCRHSIGVKAIAFK